MTSNLRLIYLSEMREHSMSEYGHWVWSNICKTLNEKSGGGSGALSFPTHIHNEL